MRVYTYALIQTCMLCKLSHYSGGGGPGVMLLENLFRFCPFRLFLSFASLLFASFKQTSGRRG